MANTKKQKHTCLICGASMRSSRENVPYDERNLPGMTLVGMTVRRCPECGEREVEIPAIEKLHAVIASVLVRAPGRLTGAEIRYLRKYLGLSGRDFARKIRVTPETVSRWETGREKMSPSAEVALRLLVQVAKPVAQYPFDLDALEGVDDSKSRTRHSFKPAGPDEWQASAA